MHLGEDPELGHKGVWEAALGDAGQHLLRCHQILGPGIPVQFVLRPASMLTPLHGSRTQGLGWDWVYRVEGLGSVDCIQCMPQPVGRELGLRPAGVASEPSIPVQLALRPAGIHASGSAVWGSEPERDFFGPCSSRPGSGWTS